MVVSIWSVLPSVRLHTSAEVIVIDSPFLDMVLVVFIVSFFPSDDHVAKDLLLWSFLYRQGRSWFLQR